MNQFTLPELYCPFPSQINKHVDVLEDYALEWVLHFNLLANELSYKRFCKSKFFLLAAAVYPYCQLEELKIANDWLSWLFIWDDQCDLSDLRKQPEVLKVFHKRFLEILNGAEITSQDIPVAHALSDLRQRMLQRVSVKWLLQFICGCENYFQGCVHEATNRVQHTIPGIDTYIIMRRLSAGVDVSLPLIELCDQLMIPDFVQKHYIFKQLKLITSNILGWSNDIFSVSREMGNGDFHNLVLVLHYQQQISLQQAIEYAVEMHDQEVRTFMNLEASVPSFGAKVDSEFTKYISGLRAWIRGNLDWYSYSSRYQTLERLELVKC